MENIEIICTKSTNKLLKGGKYEIYKIDKRKFYYLNKNSIVLNYVSNSCFKPVDDKIDLTKVEPFDNTINELSEISWKTSIIQIKFENMSSDKIRCDMIGKIVKCGKNSNSKYLLENNFYTILDVEISDNYNNDKYISRIKINNGRKNWYNSRNFHQVNMKIQRKLKMNKLVNNEKITTIKRKFLNYTKLKQYNIILKIISKILEDLESISDKSEIDFEKIIIERGNFHNIIKEDLKNYKTLINSLKILL